MAEYENGRVSLSTVLNGLATAAILAMAGFVWGMSTDIASLDKKVALMNQQLEALIARDIPTRSEVRSMLKSADFPWTQERDDWIKWRHKVDAMLEKRD